MVERKDDHIEKEDLYMGKLGQLAEHFKERKAFMETFRLPGFDAINLALSSAGMMGGMVAGTTPGNTNEEKVWNFFAAKGFSAAAVAGIMGNLQQESGIDPLKKQSGGGPGRGIMQWETGHSGNGGHGRWNSLEKWASQQGKDPWNIETQLEYMWLEMTGQKSEYVSNYSHYLLEKYHGGLENFKRIADVRRAVEIFEKSFERAGKPMYEKRYKYAEQFLQKYGNGNGGSPAPIVNGSSMGGIASGDVQRVIEIANSWISKPNKYVFGGGRSESDIKAGRFDCSSFVRYCFAEVGKDIMNNGFALWGNTDTIMNNNLLPTVSTEQLQPGDLMFFDTYKTYGHVTICLGDGKAIGTQGSTGVAVIDYINNSYWSQRISNQHKRVFT